MKFVGACFVLLCFVISTLCLQEKRLRILGLFPHPGKSHFDVFAPLVQQLAKRGHEVTVVSHFPRKGNDLPNYRDISLALPMGVVVGVLDINSVDHSMFSVLTSLRRLSNLGLITCENGLLTPEVQKLLSTDQKFDLILVELFNSDCFLGLVYKLKAPVIAVSSQQIMPWGNARFNNPDNPSYIPGLFNGLSPKMSFMERVKNTIINEMWKLLYQEVFTKPVQNIVEKILGPGIPPLAEIAMNTSAFLVNTHYSLHGSRPYLPNVIEAGGLHIREQKQLPKDIEDFLEGATEGALFFSWGSLIKAATLPEEKLNAILKVLGSIPRRVIWKWETDDLKGKPDNLMLKKWLPQFDVLSEYFLLIYSLSLILICSISDLSGLRQ